MLRQPDSIISNDFKQHRLAAADTAIIAEYEDLVTDWMNTIENILMDSSDERLEVYDYNISCAQSLRHHSGWH